MMFKTEQEEFWAGRFGDEYVERNQGEQLLASYISFYSSIVKRTQGVDSVLEFGCNIGVGLKANSMLLPKASIEGVEINETAVKVAHNELPHAKIYHSSILEFADQKQRDLVYTRGVMIHLNPDILPQVYKAMYEHSKKYILIAEYYNPAPVVIQYRGHQDRLFKRDFAGEIMDLYPDLKLVDYGFVYHKDNNYPQDDITWFLLQKD